ncbi:MAG: GNAT family protein [Pseudomonadota bacterium]
MLHLHPCSKRDIAELVHWFPDRQAALEWGGASLTWPLQKKALHRLIRAHKGREPTIEVWSAFDGTDLVGHGQLRYAAHLDSATLGRVAICPNRRGEGLGTQLMAALLAKAFSRAALHRVDLMVYTHNTPALALYNRLGFTLEGTRRETTPFEDKRWSTHMMSRLRSEYLQSNRLFDKRTEGE